MRPRLTDEQTRPVMIAAGLIPQVPYPGRNSLPWECLCSRCGRTVRPSYSNVQQGARGCKSCSMVEAAGSWKISEEQARAEMAAAGWRPIGPYKDANSPWECECLKCGNTRTPSLSSVRAGKRCKRCVDSELGSARMVPSETANSVMIAAGLIPQVDYPGSKEHWECVCAGCGQTVYPTCTNIASGDGGCQICKGRKLSELFKVPEDQARAEMAAAGWRPIGPYTTAHSRWECECTSCGRVSTPTLSHVRAGRRCQGCTTAENSAARLTPEGTARADMLAAGLHPIVPFSSANSPWPSECLECGNIVSPSLTAVRGGHGCQECAPTGFKLSKPAKVYLAQHDGFGAIKIGVTNERAYRVKQLERDGWVVLALWEAVDGRSALAAESAVIADWRASEVPLGASREQVVQGGCTGTAPLEHLDLARISAIVDGCLTPEVG